VQEWFTTVLLAPPPYGDFYPFRRNDRSKTARQLAEHVACGDFVDVMSEFGRKALGASGVPGDSVAETIFGQTFYEREQKATTASSDSRALEWMACMQRYADAVSVMDALQALAIREYARYIGELACLLSFRALEPYEKRWREACANTGVPINAWGPVYMHFQMLWSSEQAHERNQRRADAASAKEHGALSSRKRTRDRRGIDRDEHSAGPRNAAAAAADSDAKEEKPCFVFNRGQPCDGGCGYLHVCRTRQCRGNHPVTQCPLKRPRSDNVGSQGGSDRAAAAGGGTGAAGSGRGAAAGTPTSG
jgi:hypothetical protein